MYIPRTFRMPEPEAVRFMAQHPFAMLFSTTADKEPLATHLPLIRLEDGRVIGHMARANPHWRHLDGARVLAVFSGPHAYIAPEWYGSMPNVPTWNYLAVHATGTCRVLADDTATDLLSHLARFMDAESPIPQALSEDEHPDHPFYMEEVPAIVGFEIHVDRLEGKAKLGQNRSEADRRHAVAGLRRAGDHDSLGIADLMEATIAAERPKR